MVGDCVVSISRHFVVYSWCKSSVCVCGWVSFKVSVVVVCRRRRHRRRRSTFVVVRLSFVGVCRRLSFVVCRSSFVVRRLSFVVVCRHRRRRRRRGQDVFLFVCSESVVVGWILVGAVGFFSHWLIGCVGAVCGVVWWVLGGWLHQVFAAAAEDEVVRRLMLAVKRPVGST